MVLLEIKEYIMLLQSRRMVLQNALNMAVMQETKDDIRAELNSIGYKLEKYNIILKNGEGNEMLGLTNERSN